MRYCFSLIRLANMTKFVNILFWGDSGEISGLIDICFPFSGWTHEKLKSLSLRGKTGWLGDDCKRDFYYL